MIAKSFARIFTTCDAAVRASSRHIAMHSRLSSRSSNRLCRSCLASESRRRSANETDVPDINDEFVLRRGGRIGVARLTGMTIELPMSVACSGRRLIMRHVFDASLGEIERRNEGGGQTTS